MSNKIDERVLPPPSAPLEVPQRTTGPEAISHVLAAIQARATRSEQQVAVDAVVHALRHAFLSDGRSSAEVADFLRRQIPEVARAGREGLGVRAAKDLIGVIRAQCARLPGSHSEQVLAQAHRAVDKVGAKWRLDGTSAQRLKSAKTALEGLKTASATQVGAGLRNAAQSLSDPAINDAKSILRDTGPERASGLRNKLLRVRDNLTSPNEPSWLQRTPFIGQHVKSATEKQQSAIDRVRKHIPHLKMGEATPEPPVSADALRASEAGTGPWVDDTEVSRSGALLSTLAAKARGPVKARAELEKMDKLGGLSETLANLSTQLESTLPELNDAFSKRAFDAILAKNLIEKTPVQTKQAWDRMGQAMLQRLDDAGLSATEKQALTEDAFERYNLFGVRGWESRSTYCEPLRTAVQERAALLETKTRVHVASTPAAQALALASWEGRPPSRQIIHLLRHALTSADPTPEEQAQLTQALAHEEARCQRAPMTATLRENPELLVAAEDALNALAALEGKPLPAPPTFKLALAQTRSALDRAYEESGSAQFRAFATALASPAQNGYDVAAKANLLRDLSQACKVYDSQHKTKLAPWEGPGGAFYDLEITSKSGRSVHHHQGTADSLAPDAPSEGKPLPRRVAPAERKLAQGANVGPTAPHQPAISTPDGKPVLIPSSAYHVSLENAYVAQRLREGHVSVSGLSGSTNVLAGMFEGTKDAGVNMTLADFALGLHNFLVFDGGHSTHEIMWTLNKAKSVGMGSALADYRARTGADVDPHNPSESHAAFIRLFDVSNHPGAEAIRGVVDDSFAELARHLQHHTLGRK